MATVKFTNALKRFFPDLQPLSVAAQSLQEILSELNVKYPGLNTYIVDERGQLRKHVNIFIDGRMIEDRESLTDRLDDVKEIYIMQALSGG